MRLSEHTVAPVLETARLRLRGHVGADHEAVCALWTDDTVVRFIGGRARTAQESWDRLLRYAGHWAALGFGPWVVEDKASGAALGEVGLFDFHRIIAPHYRGAPEAGWVLAPEAHGKGYAVEAMQAVLAWRESTLPPGDTVCIINPDNASSLRVAAKLGFAETERLDMDGAPLILLQRGPTLSPPA